MKSPENEVTKQKWKSRLDAGEKIEIRWDAGGDETPVWVYSNDVEIDWKESEDLVTLVVEILTLPNAGEYFVKGSGILIFKDDQLLIKHSSKHEGIDYIEPDEDMDMENLENYDWAANTIEVDKTVSETTVLIP